MFRLQRGKSGRKKLYFAIDQTIQQAIDSVKENPTINLPPYERVQVLWEIKKEILESQEELAKCITLEMDKSINDSKVEIVYTANYFGWCAEEVKRIYGKENKKGESKT
ncbi:MAG: aldehyde dehydrogenase family protein [Candidatus Neptunochlamydia sp.]|nr:aldehyde dehydrogenase family protein [Candidatus Neptunochlamydia sp.]